MNYSFINIIDFLPDFLQEISNGIPNIKNSFGHYLLNLIFGGSGDNLRPGNDSTSSISPNRLRPLAGKFSSGNQESRNKELFIKSVIGKYRPDVKPFITIDELVPYFMEECAQKFLRIDQYYASYLLHMLMRDLQEGFDLDVKINTLTVCKLEHFLERSLTKYADPLDATICNTKICYYFKGCLELELNYVKKKYELNSKEQLNNLSRSILQYPETSNHEQLDEMFVKMQIFIITNYYMGCPKNSELLKQTRQSLNSVLGKGDLQKYVLKKRYHRLEYLQRLGSTVCGIVTFNSYKSHEKNDNIRNIFLDLEMAQRNTKESLDVGFKRASLCIQKGTDTMQKVIKINIKKQNLQCKLPLTKMRDVNKFIILFHVYKRCLVEINVVFEKTQHLIGGTQKKFDCVVEKIKEILKFRSAIESELIFPHFVYLSEVWTSLVLYLNHLVELNKITDHLDELLSEHLENHYYTILDDIAARTKQLNYSIEMTFGELMILPSKRQGKLDILKLQPFVKDYCALTMAFTKGLLLPSKLERKICDNQEMHFGFDNIEFAKYSERCLPNFIETFENVIFTSVDLILLLKLDAHVLQQDFDLVEKLVAKNKTAFTQTTESNSSAANHINVTWNVWDYHRETIRLANIRQQQTNSTQTNASFGKYNSQNQFCGNVHNGKIN